MCACVCARAVIYVLECSVSLLSLMISSHGLHLIKRRVVLLLHLYMARSRRGGENPGMMRGTQSETAMRGRMKTEKGRRFGLSAGISPTEAKLVALHLYYQRFII